MSFSLIKTQQFCKKKKKKLGMDRLQLYLTSLNIKTRKAIGQTNLKVE